MTVSNRLVTRFTRSPKQDFHDPEDKNGQFQNSKNRTFKSPEGVLEAGHLSELVIKPDVDFK